MAGEVAKEITIQMAAETWPTGLDRSQLSLWGLFDSLLRTSVIMWCIWIYLKRQQLITKFDRCASCYETLNVVGMGRLMRKQPPWEHLGGWAARPGAPRHHGRNHQPGTISGDQELCHAPDCARCGFHGWRSRHHICIMGTGAGGRTDNQELDYMIEIHWK